MIWFCENAREFMAADRGNVIAIHCKGGKGRTGTIICVWLVDCGIFEDAKVGWEQNINNLYKAELCTFSFVSK